MNSIYNFACGTVDSAVTDWRRMGFVVVVTSLCIHEGSIFFFAVNTS